MGRWARRPSQVHRHANARAGAAQRVPLQGLPAQEWRGRGRPARGLPAGGFPARMKACLFAGSRLVLPDGACSLPDLTEASGWNAGEAEWFPATASPPAVVGAHPADGHAGDSAPAGGVIAESAHGCPAVAARAAPGWTPPAGVSAVGLRQVLVLLQEPDLSIALTAAHLARWRRTTRFCGVCGHATEPSRRHRAMVCRACGHLAFPKVSPAVIVQVTRDDRILLGRPLPPSSARGVFGARGVRGPGRKPGGHRAAGGSRRSRESASAASATSAVNPGPSPIR